MQARSMRHGVLLLSTVLIALVVAPVASANKPIREIIPADEPVFVFRARDRHACQVLYDYAVTVKNPEHREAIFARLADFQQFADAHPKRMKEPDTPA